MSITRKQAENIASVLSEGLPYIQKFKDKIIVVKYGGAAMTEEPLKESFHKRHCLNAIGGNETCGCAWRRTPDRKRAFKSWS